MKKIKIGLIGCGGRQGAHINSLMQMDDVEIVAVADPVEERRNAVAKKVGAKRIYKDHKELYANEKPEDIDVVYIAVEPTAHDDTEVMAIEKGWHFLVEKPMTLDMDQADDIVKKIEEKGILTSVGFQDRYLDILEPVKQKLATKKSGIVFGAWIGGIPKVWWWLKKSTCGGQLVEQNIHLVDLLRYFYGEPLSVYATATTGIVEPFEANGVEYDTDDHSTAVIRYNNNVTATLFSGCYAPGYDKSGLTMITEDMTIEYILRDSTSFITKNETQTIKRVEDQTLALSRGFIDAVKSGDDSTIRSTYADALKSLKLGLAAN